MTVSAWWRVEVRCRMADTDRVAAALVQATGHGVEELALGALRSVAEQEAEGVALLEALKAEFPSVTGEVLPLSPIDWSVHWRDGIETRRMGRLIITPTWLPVTPTGDEVVVTMDPESAFGNGEHGSTRVALTLMERNLRRGCRVMDVGSGSGVLSIAAILLGAQHVMAIECDAETAPIAHANVVRNGVASRVTFLLGEAAHLVPIAGPVDLICANILRTVNTELLPVLRHALAPGGRVIFSGMERAESRLFRTSLAEADWQVLDQHEDIEWWGVLARPM